MSAGRDIYEVFKAVICYVCFQILPSHDFESCLKRSCTIMLTLWNSKIPNGDISTFLKFVFL